MKMCLGMDATCRMIIDEAHDLIDAEHGSVVLLAEKDKSLKIKAAFGEEADDKLKLASERGLRAM